METVRTVCNSQSRRYGLKCRTRPARKRSRGDNVPDRTKRPYARAIRDRRDYRCPRFRRDDCSCGTLCCQSSCRNVQLMSHVKWPRSSKSLENRYRLADCNPVAPAVAQHMAVIIENAGGQVHRRRHHRWSPG